MLVEGRRIVRLDGTTVLPIDLPPNSSASTGVFRFGGKIVIEIIRYDNYTLVIEESHHIDFIELKLVRNLDQIRLVP